MCSPMENLTGRRSVARESLIAPDGARRVIAELTVKSNAFLKLMVKLEGEVADRGIDGRLIRSRDGVFVRSKAYLRLA